MLSAMVEASVSRSSTNMGAERVVVAVKAERVISKTALAWALTHVVHPGDCVTLLAVLPSDKTGRRFWSFPRLTGDCGSSHRENLPDQIFQISESCSQMVLQFHNQIEVRVRIKVVPSRPPNAVAAEASKSGANWVILDKKLKQELKYCIEELRCNIVVVKGSQAKVLRLNLQCLNEIQTPYFSAASSPTRDIGQLQGCRPKHCTPVSSPEEPSTSYSRTTLEGSISSSETIASPFLVYEQNPLFERAKKGNYPAAYNQNDLDDPLDAPDNYAEKLITLSRNPVSPAACTEKSAFWIPQNYLVEEKLMITQNSINKVRSPTSKTLLENFVQYDKDMKAGRLKSQSHHIVNSSIRNAVSLGRPSSIPPPLCSLCQHKAPIFGKPPRQFSYEELEEATNGFSDINLLAEGGFGVVYKGLLRDGQVVAVKLLKFCSSQADADFYREVRVLSCAQHRNVVLLIGFCIDNKRRVLVYEYICNGSLDLHLHGNRGAPLDWQSRRKIAIGAARGLRYLHEDCRVGCIVHRDMHPHNILLTHDFEPLVADFGLARWYSDCSIGAEDKVIGTSGYLAPEYVDGGIITQKVDVYAFGLVILELMTGRRPTELQLYREQNFLSDWFHPLGSLQPNYIFANIYQLLDPCLANDQHHNFTHQLRAMGFAAFLCLSHDPESRPPMSKVLRILEGGDMSNTLALDSNSIGNRSGHLRGLSSQKQPVVRRTHSRRLSH